VRTALDVEKGMALIQSALGRLNGRPSA